MLAQTDAATGRPFVDVVLDQAEQKGTGRWTVQSALDLGVPITGIAEATFARALSGHAEQRGPARAAFGSDAGDLGVADRDGVRRGRAARAVRVQGRRVRAGLRPDHRRQRRSTAGTSTAGAMATIWRGGCIIRARFLDRIREAYDADPDLPSLLVAPYFAEAVAAGVDAWRRVVAPAAWPASRPRRSRPRSPTTTACAATGCRPR